MPSSAEGKPKVSAFQVKADINQNVVMAIMAYNIFFIFGRN